MAVVGDRAVASLLSAFAEAPDLPAAASFLLTQLGEMTGAPRAVMLRSTRRTRFSPPSPPSGSTTISPTCRLSASDLSNPLVLSTLALAPIRGSADARPPVPRPDRVVDRDPDDTAPAIAGRRSRCPRMRRRAHWSRSAHRAHRVRTSPRRRPRRVVVLLEGPIDDARLDDVARD